MKNDFLIGLLKISQGQHPFEPSDPKTSVTFFLKKQVTSISTCLPIGVKQPTYQQKREIFRQAKSVALAT